MKEIWVVIGIPTEYDMDNWVAALCTSEKLAAREKEIVKKADTCHEYDFTIQKWTVVTE